MSLVDVEQKIQSYLEDIDNIDILNIINDIQKGKMLRSKLILAIAPNNPQSIDLCAIVEMIHLASLLHDDVIDEADTRRGIASVNSSFGNKTSIMIGDILYSLAFCKLSLFDKEISQKISTAVMTISIGEFLDVQLSDTFNSNESKYMDMLYKKTSSLIEACSYSGAYLAGLDTDRFCIYGKNLGISFQLIDDLLDITQDSKTLGKPALHDFKEGKVTMPYIMLLRCLDESSKSELKKLYKKELSIEQEKWLRNQFQTYKIKEQSMQYINEYIKKAQEVLLPEDKHLEDLLLQMAKRTF